MATGLLSALFTGMLTLVIAAVQPGGQQAERFDMLLRADFFAGCAGDAALERTDLHRMPPVADRHATNGTRRP